MLLISNIKGGTIMSLEKTKFLSTHSTLLRDSYVDCLLHYLLLVIITSKHVFEVRMRYYICSGITARYTGRVCQLGLKLA